MSLLCASVWRARAGAPAPCDGRGEELRDAGPVPPEEGGGGGERVLGSSCWSFGPFCAFGNGARAQKEEEEEEQKRLCGQTVTG